MIYIFGNDEEFQSNIEIIDWLDFLEIKYKKITASDFLTFKKIEKLNPNDVVWLWKSSFEINNNIIKTRDVKTYNYLNQENKILCESFVSQAIQLPELKMIDVNKLNLIDIAEQVGLNIPATLVTNNKEELMKFHLLNKKKTISKPISEVEAFLFNNNSYALYTEKVTLKHINNLPSSFFPSLFQKNISKKYEIRSFFILDKLYSMAIFSSNDVKTKTDFRKYNNSKPNRNVPYKLPKEIENKIKKFMNKIGLSTGSIDILKGVDNQYYFLEVNPVGHFGMVSKGCNYNLEKEVALVLKKLNS